MAAVVLGLMFAAYSYGLRSGQVFTLGQFFLIGAPVSLVLVGGVAQALMLPFLSIAALYFRYKQTDKPLQPGLTWTVFLWISALAMSAVGLFQLYQKLS